MDSRKVLREGGMGRKNPNIITKMEKGWYEKGHNLNKFQKGGLDIIFTGLLKFMIKLI